MRYLLLVVSFLISLTSLSQISGKVISNDDPNGSPFVNIRISGTTTGTTTDIDGNYNIDVKNGEYDIIFRQDGYKIDTIHVLVDGQTTLNHTMTLDVRNIEEVVIERKVNRESENILLKDRKESSDITQNIGSRELQKSGSSNVSEGLTKVTGISTQSNYIYIRGMGDRYNNSYINGLPLASIDPDSKMMPMDIFPTQIIKNLNVSKSYNPSFYGDFSGGYLDIRTKDYTDKFTLKFDIGTGLNTQSIKPFNSYNRVSFNPYTTTPINYNFNLMVGNLFILNKHKIGFIANGYINNQYKYEYGDIRTTNAQGVRRIDYSFENYKQRQDYSGLISISYLYKKSTININSIYIKSNSNSFRETDGYHFDYKDSIFTRRYTPIERTLFINQLIGKLDMGKIILDYGVSYSKVGSFENNRRQLIYLHHNNEYRINNIDILDNHRFYSYLKENDISSKINSSYLLGRLKLDLGYDFRYKNRTFDYEQYIYDFDNPNSTVDINNPDLYTSQAQISKVQNPASKYDAMIKSHSIYLISEYKSDKITLNTGVRLEKSLQGITYRDQQQPLFIRGNKIDGLVVLPSINFKYSISKDDIIRSTVSKTISRPGFREVAPFEYTEVFAGIKTVGNPNLSNSNNYNIDLRYERYNKTSNLISITSFGKFIDNPIEKTMLATASGQLQSFSNADYAYVYGIELEYRRFIKIDSINNISIGSNLTLLKSFTKIDVSSGSVQTNGTRPLQGSSPVLFNLDISYTRYYGKVESVTTLSYNLYGRRLWSVGIQGMGDIYENTINTLNLTIKNNINKKLSIDVVVKNILNPTYKMTQKTFNGDVNLNEYKTGINIGLGVSYKL